MSSIAEKIGPSAPLWKHEISARVQAHRSRRQTQHPSVEDAGSHASRFSPRLAGVAASVAERYAAAPSYSQYLAKLTEPEMADEFGHADDDFFSQQPPAATADVAECATHGSSALDVSPALAQEAAPQPWRARAVFPPELEAEMNLPDQRRTNGAAPQQLEKFLEHAVIEPDVPIAPKLIEFPRHLIASRRARPRLAEGPLRDATAQDAADAQLRIFEVESEQISRVPLAQTSPLTDAAPAVEWHYIRLDAPLLSSPVALPREGAALDVAPLRRRGLAAALDFGLVTLGFLIFAMGFVGVASQPPSDGVGLLAAVAVFFGLGAAYQWLFLSLSDATPGMRYARIALCTFQDENPTMQQRRARVLASLLAAASAGLGYAWMSLDHERLGWADRISHTYQRCY